MPGNVVTRLKKGTAGAESPRGRAGLSLPERLAIRTISEAFRALRDPVEIGQSLLDIFDGKDPSKKRGTKANPDGLPIDGDIPLDWTHRMAAMKLFLEYGHGKPLQGVQIQALVEQHHHVHDARPVDLRSLPPEAAAALAMLARVVAGSAAGDPRQVLAVPRPPEHATLDERPREVLDVAPPEAELGGDPGDGGGATFEVDLDEDEVFAGHGITMRFDEPGVKGEKERNRGPGSAL